MRKAKKIIFRGLLTVLPLLSAAFGQSESPNVPGNWRTYAERTDYRKTPAYAETIEFSKRLDAASPLILYKNFGKSGELRDLPLLIAAKDNTFTPPAARRAGKAVVFIQAAIHAGEADGKDAGLALLRDIAITKTRLSLLDNIVLVFVPIYNTDGHENRSPYKRINQNGPEENGFRANAQNLNLNRDYMKADAPETRAWLRLWNQWDPDFFIDCHVTNGADFQYNLTYEFAHHAENHPALLNWMNRHFETNVVANTEKEGNLITHYMQFRDNRDMSKGTDTFIATPRFATGYSPLRNRIGLLIETHMLKPARSRVRATYDLVRSTLEEVAKNKEALFAANKKADQETISAGMSYDPQRNFPLRLELTDKAVDFRLKGVAYTVEKSDISGDNRVIYSDRPQEYMVPKYDDARIAVGVAPPLYYIVPPQWGKSIEVLRAHGLEMKKLSRDLEIEVESYKLTEPKWAAASFENRVTLSFKQEKIVEKRNFMAGSIVVPLAQRNAAVAIHLLEPQSPDSFVYWGFFNSIFEQKEFGENYKLEKLAREMLAKDAKLKAEFEEKLKDPAFAANPNARLTFFHRRSPYFEHRLGFYPVGRIVTKLDAALLVK